MIKVLPGDREEEPLNPRFHGSSDRSGGDGYHFVLVQVALTPIRQILVRKGVVRSLDRDAFRMNAEPFELQTQRRNPRLFQVMEKAFLVAHEVMPNFIARRVFRTSPTMGLFRLTRLQERDFDVSAI